MVATAWRKHASRFAVLGISYAGERVVMFAALFVPALLGSIRQDLGTLELLLVGGGLGSAFGPLGTQDAVMHERFASRRSNWIAAITIALVVGTAIGGVASGHLGVYGLLAGGLLGGTLAVLRVVQHRLRIADSTRPLVESTVMFVLVFGSATAIVHMLGGNLARSTPWVLGGAAVVAALPAFRVKFQDQPDASPQVMEMLRFGLPIGLASAGAWVVAAVDRYVLVVLVDVETVGTYGVIARLVQLYGGATSMLVVWWQSESYRRGHEWTRSFLARYLSIAGGLAALGGLIVGWPMVIGLAQILDAEVADIWIPVAWLLASIVCFVILTGLIAAFATASLVRPVSVAWFIAAFLNVGLNFLLIPAFEISGAAAATALALGGGAAFLAVALRRHLGQEELIAQSAAGPG